jgi:hypothetical protein
MLVSPALPSPPVLCQRVRTHRCESGAECGSFRVTCTRRAVEGMRRVTCRSAKNGEVFFNRDNHSRLAGLGGVAGRKSCIL